MPSVQYNTLIETRVFSDGHGQETTSSGPKAMRLEEKISQAEDAKKELRATEIQLNESPDKQVSANAQSVKLTGISFQGPFCIQI